MSAICSDWKWDIWGEQSKHVMLDWKLKAWTKCDVQWPNEKSATMGLDWTKLLQLITETNEINEVRYAETKWQ